MIRRYLIFALVVASVGLTCCSAQPKRTGPKFSGRVLLLNGDTATGANLSELTTSGDGYNLAPLTGNEVFEAVASLDHNQLLYTTKDEIMLRDLRSSAAKSIIKGQGQSFCLAWAPDGKRFSYKQKSSGQSNGWKIYVAEADGKTKMLWEDPIQSSDCGHWIAADRLVFDRFVGALQKQSAGANMKPNTTTVATVGEPLKFRDTPKKWNIEGVCPKGNNALVRAVDQSQLLIARNVDHYESIDPSPGPCSECRFVGYAAQSCVPFFIEQPTSTTTDLFSLNPANWQKQRPTSITWTFSPAAKMLIKSSARLMVVGDVPDKLLLINTETGDVTPFFPNLNSAPALKSPAPIAWIEN